MGKLNIAHHKSYHPYRRDNIEKVRRDEEEARLKEAKEEGRMMLADAEARIDALRQKAGVTQAIEKKDKKGKGKDREDERRIKEGTSMGGAVLPTTNGHINLFEDLEHSRTAIASAIRASTSKKAGAASTTAETEKGVPLAPSAKDLNPWYSDRTKDKLDQVPQEEDNEKAERRRREESRKSANDPLTSITRQLAAARSTGGTSTSGSFSRSMRPPRPPPPKGTPSRAEDKPPEVQARLTRESSERERALALIQRKKREMLGNATPSTVAGDDESSYGDVYNRREVEDARRRRDGGHGRRRSWDDERRSNGRQRSRERERERRW